MTGHLLSMLVGFVFGVLLGKKEYLLAIGLLFVFFLIHYLP
jgi:hypothetical protein